MAGSELTIRMLLICALFPAVVLSQIPDPQQTKRSVVHLVTDEGTCNGVLLNHTKAAEKTYLLTAAHCVRSENSLRSVILGRDYLTGNSIVRAVEWQSNALTRLVSSQDLDYLLIELAEPVPDYIFPYFAGWQANPDLPPATYSIHAPMIEKLLAEDQNVPVPAT
ncbi:MAG: hypothetical protein WBA74_19390, partial [Cyclobacteriaceae bacterium]